MNRFQLLRLEDVTNVSGTGIVAEGCEFSTGKVCVTWLTQFRSTTVYDSMADVIAIHGHGGKTVVQWIDQPDFVKDLMAVGA